MCSVKNYEAFQNPTMGVEKHSMSVLHVDLDRLGITES